MVLQILLRVNDQIALRSTARLTLAVVMSILDAGRPPKTSPATP
jgi:hypothetical protein